MALLGGLLVSLHLPCYSLLILLIHVIPYAASVSFNFDFAKSSYASDLNYSNDSYWAKPVIELTKADRYAGINDSVGRVWFAQPVPLWDPSTGAVASFSTNFSFQIISGNDSKYGPGDGMAFFLSYYPSATPPDSFGGALGLFSSPVVRNDGRAATGDERVVAVEFDTHSNGDWESDSHVGIDVNSIVSVASKDVGIAGADSGGSSITLSSGLPMTARVTYNNDTTLLSVDLQIPGAPYPYHVSTNVDMTKCLPDTVAVGFSAATGDFFELHQLLSWSFTSDLEAAAVPSKSHSQLPPTTTSSPRPSTTVNASAAAAARPHDNGVAGAAAEGPAGSKKQQHGVRAETLALAIVSILLCIVVIAGAKMAASSSRCRWYGKQHAREEKIGHHGPRLYQYRELVKATNNFDEQRKLGRGGSGEVYRGDDDKGRQVAVKKLTSIGTTNEETRMRREFQAEVEIISRLRHKNLVRLFGWCDDSSHGLHLVYERIPGGSLDNYLYPADERPLGPPLSWDDRYRIILGLGKALVYLHGEHSGTKYVVHGDIKPSNIMLDKDLNAKLGDFGLARLVDHGAAPPTTSVVMGTRGYVEPEFLQTRKRCKESDVYSFGIVLLEMVTGHGPVSQPLLRQRVWELYGHGKVLEAASPALRSSSSSESNGRQMERVLVVGLWCTHQARSERPPIERAMGALEHAADAAVLPPDLLPLTLAGAHGSDPPEQRLQIHGDDVALLSSHYSNTGPATATAGEQAYGGSSSAVTAGIRSGSVHPSSATATHSTSYTTCTFGVPGASASTPLL